MTSGMSDSYYRVHTVTKQMHKLSEKCNSYWNYNGEDLAISYVKLNDPQQFILAKFVLIDYCTEKWP